ncbi:MAG: rRNA pseudouridine synthase, partial [Rickettsiales bacterium]|nr:rRNA pseudouridine synthase [Rickettsiales bacterium]
MQKDDMRIAKLIARNGAMSRREAERAILAGRVKVNGAAIASPALNVTGKDKVEIDGRPLAKPEATRLFIYHKPAGLIVSHSDENGRKTVFDALPKEYGRLISIGRLDLNSEGLLLLTNDGEFERFMESPKNEFEREYQVRVHGVPSKDDMERLARGMTVDGIRYRPIDVKIDRTLSTNSWLTVKLHEGKNREIRRTLESLGYEVNRLVRVSYAGLKLRGLESGKIYEVKIPSAL